MNKHLLIITLLFVLFAVSVTATPLVFDLIPVLNTPVNTNANIEVGANITDGDGIKEVNITTWDGMMLNTLMLAYSGVGNWYNTSVNTGINPGSINITFFAWDNLDNLNDSEWTNVSVTGGGGGGASVEVGNLKPSLNSIFNATDVIEMGATITTSPNQAQYAQVNVTYPNSTVETVVLVDTASGGVWNKSYTIPSLEGDYVLSYWVNDSVGNINGTEVSNFTVDTIIAKADQCGLMNTNVTLNTTLSSIGTCITINASDLTLDCAGNNITWGIAGGTGVPAILINPGYNNLTIKDCGLIDGNTSGSSREGIEVSHSIGHNFSSNTITINSTQARGIRITNISHSTFASNIIDSFSSSGRPIEISCGATCNNTNLTFTSNVINTTHDNLAYGVYLEETHSSTFTNNQVYTEGSTTCNALRIINDVAHNTFENNIFENTGSSGTSSAIFIDNQATNLNNTFLNNNLTSTSSYVFEIDGGGETGSNTLIYNNSFGQITWTGLSFTTDVDLIIGESIEIEDNLLSFPSSTTGLNLSTIGAKIELRGLPYTNQPNLLKDGIGCSNTDACNASYTGGILSANISSFSTYTTVGCGGTITSSSQLESNLTGTDTCFNITSSDVILDCNGYTITYGSSGTGVGVDVFNTANNVTVKNCVITKSGSSGNSNYGISFTSSDNSLIQNNTISTNGVASNDGVLITGTSENVLIELNTITTTGSGNGNLGIYLVTSTDSINITNNIITAGDIGSSYGIRLDSDNHIVYNNDITTSGSGSLNVGVRMIGSSSNHIYYNNITTGASDTNIGFYGTASSNNNNLTNNILTTVGTIGDTGFYFDTSDGNNFIDNNVTSLTGYGIYFDDTTNSNVESNVFHSNKSGYYGVSITGATYSNIFLNNNITSETDYEIFDDTGASYFNRMIYNNTYGQIIWNLSNLSTDVPIAVDDSIFLQQNLVGLTDNVNVYNLDGVAEIEIRNLSYISTPRLLKDGVRCDDTDDCNISYNVGSGILSVDISSFSNYTTSAIDCGYLNSDTTMNQNVTSNNVCFTINSSDITLDCAGYTISYGNDGSSLKNAIRTVSYNNITIKNCILEEGNSSGISKWAIYFDDSANNTIYNNSVYTHSQTAAGIYLTGTTTLNNNISDNYLESNGSGGDGLMIIYSSDNLINNNIFNTTGIASAAPLTINTGNNNNITNNILNIDNSVSTGSVLSLLSSNNCLVENNEITNGGTSNGVYLLTTSSNTLLKNNNITSNGRVIYDVTSNEKTLLYNNSFGNINWTSTDISTNISLGQIGTNLFIQDNLIGLIDNKDTLQLNSSALLTFYSLPWEANIKILKDGVRCDLTDICNISSYDNVTGTAIVSVNSFSNYTTTNNTNPIFNGTISNSTSTTDSITPVTITINLSSYFSDADGDTLYYTVNSGSSTLYTSSIADGILTISIGAASFGSATLNVTATDNYTSVTSNNFTITSIEFPGKGGGGLSGTGREEELVGGFTIGDGICEYSQGEDREISVDDCKVPFSNQLKCLFDKQQCFDDKMRTNIIIMAAIIFSVLMVIGASIVKRNKNRGNRVIFK